MKFMYTKAFYQKGTHSFQNDALLFICSGEFEAALFTTAWHICLNHKLNFSAISPQWKVT